MRKWQKHDQWDLDLIGLEDKVEAILDWAEDQDGFDTTTIKSILSWHQSSRDGATAKQIQALDNIIMGWGIPL